MCKVVCLILLLPGLALAQSAGVAPSSTNVNPLAGVTFWPKAQSNKPLSASLITRIRVSNVPDPRLRTGKTYKLDEIRNRIQGRPGSGRCAIPLLQFTPPTGRNFTVQRLVPAPIDGISSGSQQFLPASTDPTYAKKAGLPARPFSFKSK